MSMAMTMRRCCVGSSAIARRTSRASSAAAGDAESGAQMHVLSGSRMSVWGRRSRRRRPETWGERLGVGRVERLHAGLVVAVEWRDSVDAGGGGAEVVVGGVGEPHADLVEVNAHALSVDQRAGERLRDDQPERVARVAPLVGGE